MLTQDIVFRFFRAKPALNHSQIEKEAGLPSKTLYRALGGHINLNEKHLTKLIPVLRSYGFSEELFSKARVISIVNHKGGVGKTTSTINLGKALSLLGNRVLMLDMDSQGNLSQCFGIHQPETQIIDALLDKKSLPIIKIEPKLHLAPSDIQMAYRELELVNSIGSEKRLANKLAPLLSEYDYVLIDCPPSLGLLTVNGLMAAMDGVIVPVQCEYLALEGLGQLTQTIERVRSALFPELEVRGVVLTMFDNRTNLSTDVVEEVNKHFPNQVFKSVVPRSIRLAEAPSYGLPISEYAPTSVGALAYEALAKELLKGDKA